MRERLEARVDEARVAVGLARCLAVHAQRDHRELLQDARDLPDDLKVFLGELWVEVVDAPRLVRIRVRVKASVEIRLGVG